MGKFGLEWLEQPQEKEQIFTPNPDVFQQSEPQPQPVLNLDLEALKKESQDVADRKANLGLFGAIGDALSSGQSFGNFYSGKMNEKNNTASRMTGAVSDSIQDPMAREQKAMAYLESRQKAKASGDQQSYLEALKKDDSPQSKAFKASLVAGGIPIEAVKDVPAFDLYNAGYSPSKIAEIKAKAQIDYDKAISLQDRKFAQDKVLNDMQVERELRKEGVRYGIDQQKEEKKDAKDKEKQNREFKNRYKSINDEIDAIHKMIDEKGTYEAFGDHNASLAQKIDSVAIDAAKLFDPQSVARESEVAAFKKMLFEPGSLTTRNSTAKGVLNSFKAMLDRRAKSHTGEDLSVEKRELSQQDKQALEWANANKNDPRAAEIFKRNGIGVVAP